MPVVIKDVGKQFTHIPICAIIGLGNSKKCSSGSRNARCKLSQRSGEAMLSYDTSLLVENGGVVMPTPPHSTEGKGLVS